MGQIEAEAIIHIKVGDLAVSHNFQLQGGGATWEKSSQAELNSKKGGELANYLTGFPNLSFVIGTNSVTATTGFRSLSHAKTNTMAEYKTRNGRLISKLRLGICAPSWQ